VGEREIAVQEQATSRARGVKIFLFQCIEKPDATRCPVSVPNARDEARRRAANIAKLPDLLQRPSVRTKYPNMRKWDEMTDRQKIVLFRDAAERLRAKPTARVRFMTAEEWADAFDDHADQIEAGDLDEESPEQAAAETEAAKQVIELLERYDAGSLGALFKRFER
jgi:hypothetical protein